jgi:polar amino acid transport system permease protein
LNFLIPLEYADVLLKGLASSIGITVAAIAGGFLLGTCLACAYQTGLAPLRWLIVSYVEVFRNTPLLVQLIWIHFALPALTGIITTPLQSGLIGIIIQAGAYFTEIVRAGIGAVPVGQMEAAKSLGMTPLARWLKVILPQAIQIVIPPIVNLVISMFKATAILTVLQINELMSVATRIANATFKPIEIFTTVAVLYFAVGYAVSRYTLGLERVLAARVR